DDGLPQVYTNIQLAEFVKCTGQNSEVQTFQIGGQTISKTDGRFIVVTAPTGWEVSKDPNTLSYKDTVRYYPNTNNEVMPAKTVSIRMKTTANDNVYSGDLEISTFNASTIAVPLNGSLNIPFYSGISPNVQYVNTTNSATQNNGTIPSPSPAATSSPVAVELSDVNGTVQWQKSSDNSTWTDITGATDETYTLPDADLNAEGIVYVRAQISVCSATTNTDAVAILENLGVPAPPVFSASNGQTLSGTYDASLATQLSIYDNTNTAIATCSDLSGSTTCAGWSFVNGTFTYTPSSSYSDGDAFYAIAGNSAGGASQSSESVVVDATAPGTPVIAANTDGSSVSGTAEAGSTVTLSLNNGGTITTVDVVASANGTWSYVPVPEIANGVVISAIATDAVGNQSSASTSVTVDAIVPTNTPTYADADGDGLTDGTTVDGTTEPGAVVTVTMPNGDEYTTTADATTGVYSITVSGTITSDGDELAITIEDAAGNEMPTATYTVDKTAPTANIYATDGTTFSGVLDGEGYTVSLEYGTPASTQSLTVTGSGFDWTPSSSLGLSAGDQVTYTISDEVGNETTYTITVQAEVYCIPAHSTGIAIQEFTFNTGVSDITFSSFLSDTYSDRTTTTTIELQHDAKPELSAKSPPPTNGPPTTVYYKIWVDYNQDGDFSDNDEAIDGSSTTKNLFPNSSQRFHSWLDINITSPLPDVPFEDLADGSEYTMRIGLSSTAAGVSDPCGSSSETANFQDIKIKVLNCEDPSDFTAAQASNGSAQLDVDFSVELSSLDISYVIAKAQSSIDNPFDNGQYDDVD
ncbi:Ig-like domain-containing protein, partial [Schleiferiaceae bacterium]|nr:Ig-like domain-containing protein [Schleiferiaceae bacterium]